MPSGRRRIVFVVLVGACMLLAAVAIASGVRESKPAGGSSAAAADALGAAQAQRRPILVFRSLNGGGAGAGGRLAAAPIGRFAGQRKISSLNCDRVYFAAGSGICLARGTGFAAGYHVKVLGADLGVRHELAVEGVPSRARVSPDGRYGSVTLFVSGHSYADAGSFSTQTTLIDLARGEKLADLEQFAVTRDGRQVTAVDTNFWGVTFAQDSDRFYATMATGGKTYLIEGSVSEHTARVIHENVECPSLSPDGTRIAFKKRTNSDISPWRLTVLDLATMRETPLGETDSVDDQAEWLDDAHVLYGVHGEIRVVRADGSGQPRRFLSQAASPAVVRW